MRIRTLGTLLAATWLSLAGCAADDTPDTPDTPLPAASAPDAPAASILLARVATPTGSTAELWQVEPGRILFTEAGGPGTRPAATAADQDLATVWQRIAPATPMPGALVLAGMLASERVDAPDAPPEAVRTEASSGVPAGTAAARQALASLGLGAGTHGLVSPPPSDPNDFCSPAWFYNNLAGAYCNPDDWLSYTWCWYDRWSPYVGSTTDVFDQGAVCNYNSSNDVIFYINRQGVGASSGSWSLPSKSWRTWSFSTGQHCSWGSCSFNYYNMQTGFSGSWGDLHFAGGICGTGHAHCSTG